MLPSVLVFVMPFYPVYFLFIVITISTFSIFLPTSDFISLVLTSLYMSYFNFSPSLSPFVIYYFLPFTTPLVSSFHLFASPLRQSPFPFIPLYPFLIFPLSSFFPRCLGPLLPSSHRSFPLFPPSLSSSPSPPLLLCFLLPLAPPSKRRVWTMAGGPHTSHHFLTPSHYS